MDGHRGGDDGVGGNLSMVEGGMMIDEYFHQCDKKECSNLKINYKKYFFTVKCSFTTVYSFK